MKPVLIRTAVLEDATALAPLLAQLGYSDDLPFCQERLSIFIDTPGYGVAVACVSDTIAGFIAWSQAYLFVQSKRRIRIEGLVIDTLYRRQGVGKALIHHFEDIIQRYAPCVIELTSSLKRAQDGTHTFYQDLGYRNEGSKTTVYLRKEIS